MLQMMRVIDKATEAREYGLGLLLVSQGLPPDRVRGKLWT